MEEFPNVMIIPTEEITPDEIVKCYTDMIQYNIDRGIPLEKVLHMFFNDVELWAYKHFFIDQARYCLQELENIHNTYFDEDEDWNEYNDCI